MKLLMRSLEIRCDLTIVEGDEGAGEPVDPNPVFLTVGAN
jgi:hypothetical protein